MRLTIPGSGDALGGSSANTDHPPLAASSDASMVKMMEELAIPCDHYIVHALENETRKINRFNLGAGLCRVDIREVAREVLADWAIRLLLERNAGKSH